MYNVKDSIIIKAGFSRLFSDEERYYSFSNKKSSASSHKFVPFSVTQYQFPFIPPGFFFSGYKQVKFFATGIISMPQYKAATLEYLKINGHEKVWEEYNKTMLGKGYSHDVPKEGLVVKLKKSLTNIERDTISNGIRYKIVYEPSRSYFKDDTIRCIDSKKQEEAADTTFLMLQMFLTIVASIAILLAFFLLWVSNISNIRENLWEFGVLRYYRI